MHLAEAQNSPKSRGCYNSNFLYSNEINLNSHRSCLPFPLICLPIWRKFSPQKSTQRYINITQGIKTRAKNQCHQQNPMPLLRHTFHPIETGQMAALKFFLHYKKGSPKHHETQKSHHRHPHPPMTTKSAPNRQLHRNPTPEIGRGHKPSTRSRDTWPDQKMKQTKRVSKASSIHLKGERIVQVARWVEVRLNVWGSGSGFECWHHRQGHPSERNSKE